MPRALLVDTNFSAAPIYNHLIDSGFEVWVIGNAPSQSLAKSVDNYISLDYSNIEETMAAVQALNIDVLVPGCNDRSMSVCSRIASRLPFMGIDPPDTVEVINNKERFRTFAGRWKLQIPKVFSSNSPDLVYPVIVKPTDAYSGQGITVLQGPEKLASAIEHAKDFSSSGQFLVEQFIEGQLYSHSAFLQEGKIEVDFFVEEHGSVNPFVVDTSWVVNDLPTRLKEEIRVSITRMAQKLGLVDGLVHTQFMRNGDKHWLIEVTRRCPGDLYSQLIELSTGYPYAAAYTSTFTGEKIPKKQTAIAHSNILRHTITCKEKGNFGSAKFNQPVHIEKLVPLSLTGDQLRESPFSRIGVIFLKCDSEDELILLADRTMKD